ncbi:MULTISPECIES: hypothetical protein [Paraburkholderia]|uniref:DUF4239 domain-containing protein n=1 Tax=Paraburkholderia madseniana TaxID=2599607 RepID=A0AAP5BKM6_9BURK|nr:MULTISPECIES: hypothetical protein [Paraburkholderia]MCX4149931.1 hypothetical protein [Paraburkholderia madseniana]MDN7152867.1 hypothetical protein [Paraburkholderia sp. WS6]MDQ6411749.1 hypothetical protein [Paraburkholderia madseniana]
MNPIVTSALCALLVFAGGVGGIVLHRLLPETHQTIETRDVVRLAIGMLSVLASLVLGLLISTAKASSDSTDHDVRSFSADVILLSETLRDYGQTAAIPAGLLRDFTVQTIRDIWPTDEAPAELADERTGQTLEHVREQIRALKPVDAGQHWLQDQALQSVTSLIRQRWQLIEHQGPNIRPIVLIVLVSWITVIFASFGFNAPQNATVVTAFMVGACAIGGAIFLVLAMDNPFHGLLRISSIPMQNALLHVTSWSR